MRARVVLIAIVFSSIVSSAFAQPSARGVMVGGSVQDQTGAILPGASVQLVTSGGVVIQTVVSDTAGAFHFDRVPSGDYNLRVEFPGFAARETRLRVGGRAPAPLTIVMQIEGLAQEVSVSGGGNETSARGDANLDAVSVGEKALDDMPILDNDVIGALSRFLDSSAIGTNGATVVVDGVEVNALSVSASAVQQVKINHDPVRRRIHAARARPDRDHHEAGRPRLFRHVQYPISRLRVLREERVRCDQSARAAPDVRGNARRAGRGRRKDRLHDFGVARCRGQSVDRLRRHARAGACSPTSRRRSPTRSPRRRSTASRATRTRSRCASHISTTASTNQGVGGIKLPEAARDTSEREDDITYSQQTIVSSTLLHEFRLMVGVENGSRPSACRACRGSS